MISDTFLCVCVFLARVREEEKTNIFKLKTYQ